MYSGCMNVKRMVRMFSVLGSIVGIALWQYKLTLDFKSTGLGTEDCPLGSSRMAVASSIGMLAMHDSRCVPWAVIVGQVVGFSALDRAMGRNGF